jgi:hypothetical protein
MQCDISEQFPFKSELDSEKSIDDLENWILTFI